MKTILVLLIVFISISTAIAARTTDPALTDSDCTWENVTALVASVNNTLNALASREMSFEVETRNNIFTITQQFSTVYQKVDANNATLWHLDEKVAAFELRANDEFNTILGNLYNYGIKIETLRENATDLLSRSVTLENRVLAESAYSQQQFNTIYMTTTSLSQNTSHTAMRVAFLEQGIAETNYLVTQLATKEAGEILSVNNKIMELKEWLNETHSNVVILEEDLVNADARIDGLSTAFLEAKDEIDLKFEEAASTVTDLKIQVTAAEYYLDQAEQDIQTIKEKTVPALNANTSFVLLQVRFAEEAIEELESRVHSIASELKNDVVSIQDAATSLTTRVVALESVNGSSVIGLASAVQQLQKEVPVLTTNVSAATIAVATLRTELVETEERLQALATREQKDLTDLGVELGSTNKRVAALEAVNGSSPLGLAAAVMELKDTLVPGVQQNVSLLWTRIQTVQQTQNQLQDQINILRIESRASVAKLQKDFDANITHYDTVIADLKSQLTTLAASIKPQCKESKTTLSTSNKFRTQAVDLCGGGSEDPEGLSPTSVAIISVVSAAGGAILLGVAVSCYRKRKSKEQPLLSLEPLDSSGNKTSLLSDAERDGAVN